MALLHYNNLDVARPDILLKSVFFGLKTFNDFLRRTKDYMESDAAVKRLAWKPGTPPEDDQAGSPRGFWIQLEEPRDRPNEPESTFRAFMDENVRDVFERIADGPDASADRRSNGRKKFADDRRLLVLDRDPETSQLLVDRRPKGEELLLRPNTLTLLRQIQALQALQNAPSPAHRPLLRLTESAEHARWPSFEPAGIEDGGWMVLTDETRPGTDEQRRFVEIALATPDFVLLEGPPGSGKTTAICELVLQLAKQGKRALLCASTHVAVDNVLERLMDERNPHRDWVIPVRIGERRNVSEKAGPWQLERFVKTERERLLRHLDGRRGLSESQQALLDELRSGPSAIERMVLDAANLVCGTTIGILQHPDIKASGHAAANFDVLIVDEAHLINDKKEDAMLTSFIKATQISKIVGLTASPYRLESKTVRTQQGQFRSESYLRSIIGKDRLFKSMPYLVETAELVARGFLARINYRNEPVPWTELVPSASGFTKKSINAFERKNKITDKAIRQILQSDLINHKTITFAASLEHAEIILAATENKVDIALISSKTPAAERAQLIKDYKENRLRHILNFGTLTVGFDSPDITAVILARPTASPALYYQMIGRGIRQAPEGNKLLQVYDLCGNFDKYGKVEDIKMEQDSEGLWHLFVTGKEGRRQVDGQLLKTQIFQTKNTALATPAQVRYLYFLASRVGEHENDQEKLFAEMSIKDASALIDKWLKQSTKS